MDRWLETGSLKNIKTSAKSTGIDVEASTSKSAEEDRGVTAAVQAGFSDQSLTADATELLDLELSNNPTSSDISSTIKETLKRKYHDSYLDIGFAETTDNKSQRKYIELGKVQKCLSYHSNTVNEKALMASYLVSYRIAQAGEAHTVAENLIKPCVKDIIECMFDEKAAKVIDTIPLSNDTISRRIGDLAENVKSTLISRIKSTKFSLQMDE
ncbi:Zinc finger BED domain-containing protein 5 [Araneus ventricosus]|uniref:Zinc finger BED domain-containing protein 5 n=1 Tax=Araneus ventricosus TaxID=182803 RepID=A0A4Y2E3F5_ARAVE|nr:Zinc finger BED domain-containing protein 5 [Araneus ventricosus]